jgi:hypothetical protein
MSWLIVLLVVIAVIAVGALVYMQWRSAELKRRFGPEYDRAVETQGGRRQAEAGLRDILRRRHELDVQPLPAPVQDRFEQRWREVQLRFVDEPGDSVREADALVAEVLRERGYPADREERMAMLSADHPEVVASYRTAQGAGADAGVEPLRVAFVHYREVFERLVESPVPSPQVAPANVDDVRGRDRDRDWDRDDLADRDDGEDGEERPSPWASAYGTVVGAARRIDPAGRISRRRERDGADT